MLLHGLLWIAVHRVQPDVEIEPSSIQNGKIQAAVQKEGQSTNTTERD